MVPGEEEVVLCVNFGQHRRHWGRRCVAFPTTSREQRENQCDKYYMVSRQAVFLSSGGRPFARMQAQGHRRCAKTFEANSSHPIFQSQAVRTSQF